MLEERYAVARQVRRLNITLITEVCDKLPKPPLFFQKGAGGNPDRSLDRSPFVAFALSGF